MISKSQLVIIGAGGQGKVCADMAELLGYATVVFLDDFDTVTASGKVSEFVRFLADSVFFVAIGNSRVRERILGQLQNANAEIVTLIHPAATVSKYATIGWGSVVMAGAVVNAGARIGNGVIINTCASVDHDCAILDYAHVAVGAHVCGTVNVGAHTWIGAGATVINNVDICDNCMIGAGAVVVDEITAEGTYMGVPARRSK